MAVRVFRVSGEIRKPNLLEPMKFTKEVPAAREAHALERVYAEMGSRHRAKRYHIKILRVEAVEEAPEVGGREGAER